MPEVLDGSKIRHLCPYLPSAFARAGRCYPWLGKWEIQVIKAVKIIFTMAIAPRFPTFLFSTAYLFLNTPFLSHVFFLLSPSLQSTVSSKTYPNIERGTQTSSRGPFPSSLPPVSTRSTKTPVCPSLLLTPLKGRFYSWHVKGEMVEIKEVNFRYFLQWPVCLHYRRFTRFRKKELNKRAHCVWKLSVLKY